MTWDTETLARVCRQAEIRFAGVDCGIMDQYSVAAGRKGMAMLLDCQSLQTKFAEIPDDIAFVVIDSGAKHQLPESGYNDRADECRQAVSILNDPNVPSLRFANEDLINNAREQLGDTLYRRCRHVVTENQRTLDTFEALRKSDLEPLGELLNASHTSLRDDYEVSCDPIEALISIVIECEGRTRRTNGGRRIRRMRPGSDRIESSRKSNCVRQQEIRRVVIGGTPWSHVVKPAVAASEVHLE